MISSLPHLVLLISTIPYIYLYLIVFNRVVFVFIDAITDAMYVFRMFSILMIIITEVNLLASMLLFQ